VLPGTVGAGPHSHHGRDEFFYVLKGEVVLRVGHESHTAQAGTFVFIPRETIHGFHNASEESATLGSSPADDPGIGGAGFESTNDEDGTVLRLALNRRLRTSVECGGATP
jgi:quercetin dioxygenase-like cupin family protein